MATVGNLWINVKANTAGLSKGLGKSKGMLGKFGKFVASPAGLAVVAFAGLTAGIMATTKALSASLKEFMAFDKAMSEVKSVLLDLSGNQFDGLTKKAKLLGATTANTATEIAGAMANLARAGFKEGDGFTQIQDAIKSVSDLANATGMEMAEAADIIAIGVKAFGLEASEATRVADVLALTASKTNTTVTELGDGMKYVAPVAKQLGFSIEETSAMLGKLSDAGIKGSEGGTALRKIFLMLGKDIEKNGTQAFYDFMESQKGVTANFEKFGARAVTGAGVLQDMAGQTAKLTEELNEASGAIDKMATRQLDNLAGDVTLFQSAVSGLKIAIGEELEPTFRAIVEVATQFIVGLQGAFQGVMKGVEGSAISTDALTKIFKTLGLIIFQIIGHAIMMYNKIAFGFNALKMVGAGVLTAISGIVQAIVEAVAWGLNAVGLMSDDTYNSTVGFMRDLTVELAKTTADLAVDTGKNFIQSMGGGMSDANKMFEDFENAMDNGLPVEEVKSKGEEIGNAVVDGVAVVLKNELPEATKALLQSTDTLSDALQKQIAEFGKSKGEVLALALAEKGLSNAKIENVLAMEKQIEAMKEKKKEDDRLISDAKKVIESLRTPQEVYDAEVSNLQKMVDAKLLTLEQFEKAVSKLKMGTEDDIEINIVTKGIVEGLQTALGTVKVAGSVSKAEVIAEQTKQTITKTGQVTEKMLTVQENMKTLTEAVEDNTGNMSDELSGIDTTLGGTLNVQVDNLQGEVNKAINNSHVYVDNLVQSETLLRNIDGWGRQNYSEAALQTTLLKEISIEVASEGGELV